MIFESTDSYISTDELSMAVDAAVRLERPLLIKGEPGTGKTQLAIEVAKALNMELLEWHIKSTTKAVNGLYEYDAVSFPFLANLGRVIYEREVQRKKEVFPDLSEFQLH